MKRIALLLLVSACDVPSVSIAFTSARQGGYVEPDADEYDVLDEAFDLMELSYTITDNPNGALKIEMVDTDGWVQGRVYLNKRCRNIARSSREPVPFAHEVFKMLTDHGNEAHVESDDNVLAEEWHRDATFTPSQLEELKDGARRLGRCVKW